MNPSRSCAACVATAMAGFIACIASGRMPWIVEHPKGHVAVLCSCPFVCLRGKRTPEHHSGFQKPQHAPDRRQQQARGLHCSVYMMCDLGKRMEMG
mmetsp:Transcript_5823/g.15790  ORF Transcript_5823/g.15790 Transcript_5823/m.15790 type:complete len:96 (+) Transcript_5823:277-564(+)